MLELLVVSLLPCRGSAMRLPDRANEDYTGRFRFVPVGQQRAEYSTNRLGIAPTRPKLKKQAQNEPGFVVAALIIRMEFCCQNARSYGRLSVFR